MIKKLLAGTDIEARHEYMRNAYQRDAALYYLGKLPPQSMAEKLIGIYYPACHYSESPIFLDSSHKLAWVVNILAGVFPTAKFIHLVRDGRKVVSSFFYKLNIFDDYSAGVLRDWMGNDALPMPPLEEKFWQIPYWEHDRFKRICLHWDESNGNIIENIPTDRSIRVKLEDLTSDHNVLGNFMEFLDIPESYEGSFMKALQHPEHVYVPIDYQLTAWQKNQFAHICGDMMKTLGYNIEEEEYHVKY